MTNPAPPPRHPNPSTSKPPRPALTMRPHAVAASAGVDPVFSAAILGFVAGCCFAGGVWIILTQIGS